MSFTRQYIYPFYLKVLDFRYRFLRTKNQVAKKPVLSDRMGIVLPTHDDAVLKPHSRPHYLAASLKLSRRCYCSQQKGMSLIEILVAFVILAFGMMGIAGMLILSSKANNSSYVKQQAVQCIYDIFDRMRANYQAAINGSYNISNINSSGTPVLPSAPGTKCNQSACSSTQMAAYDIWYWLTYDVTRLPQGSGSITTTTAPGTSGNTLVTVTVQWDDSLAQKAAGSSSATSATNPNYVQLSIQSQL